MSFADRLLSVITLTIGLITIPDLLDTSSTHTHTHTVIAFSYITARGGVHICKVGWREGVGLPFPSSRSLPCAGKEYHMAWVKWIDWNAFSEI